MPKQIESRQSSKHHLNQFQDKYGNQSAETLKSEQISGISDYKSSINNDNYININVNNHKSNKLAQDSILNNYDVNSFNGRVSQG